MLRFLIIFSFFIFPFLNSQEIMIVGIAGGSGSGKTRFAKNIQQAFGPNASLIEQDCYYKDLSHLNFEERTKVNFDHPDSIDFSLLYQHLVDLKNGKSIEKPAYSFINHSKMQNSEVVSPTKIIIVEGILLFCIPELRNLFDLKIFIDTDDDIRILRRLERDTQERGRDFASVKEQYTTTVKPMHMQFVEPSKVYADVIVPSITDNEEALKLVLSRLNEVLQ